MVEIAGLVEAIVAFFIITDPFSSIPVFLAITRKMKDGERAAAAGTAVKVAGGVLVGFTLAGPQFLSMLGIRLESFQIAGGILLLLMGITFAFGLHMEQERKRGRASVSSEVVLIGVPLICGPGAMTTALLLSGTHGIFTVLVAAVVAIGLAYAVLRMANPIHRILGERGLEISSRLMGIVLAAIGIEFVRLGLGM